MTDVQYPPVPAEYADLAEYWKLGYLTGRRAQERQPGSPVFALPDEVATARMSTAERTVHYARLAAFQAGADHAFQETP